MLIRAYVQNPGSAIRRWRRALSWSDNGRRLTKSQDWSSSRQQSLEGRTISMQGRQHDSRRRPVCILLLRSRTLIVKAACICWKGDWEADRLGPICGTPQAGGPFLRAWCRSTSGCGQQCTTPAGCRSCRTTLPVREGLFEAMTGHIRT